jgi:hypothetical protein
LCVLAISLTGFAHFVFVVPETGGLTARVLLSETLQPDAQVDVSLIASAQLSLRDADGRETPLALAKGEHAFLVALPSDARGVVHGLADLGVMKTGTKPHVLLYHPKTILGDPFDPRSQLRESVPVELVPTGRQGSLRLQLLTRGKAQPNAEVTVISPDGTQKVVKTDADGQTEAFAQSGRYGAWARYWESKPGERQGQTYEEVRHYATLVFETGDPSVTAASRPDPVVSRFATLPEPTSSFGAAVSDGWLYVYGGHVVRTHAYSTEAVSGRFSRLNLADGTTWERLPDGPPLQGMNLLAHRGRIYRVGGMQPRNKPGEPQDVRSVADVSRFDPATRQWEALPPLPSPRSSHDVVAVGDRLIVVGGWSLKGKDGTDWPESMDVLDLSAPTPVWNRIPQPFSRRALTAVARDGKVYVLGGFDERSQVVRQVSIYDVATGSWSSGPDLPGGQMSGFGPAACVLGASLYLSIDDGGLYTLNGSAWDRVSRTTPRIVHRCVAAVNRIVVLGGAHGGNNSDLVEAVTIAR